MARTEVFTLLPLDTYAKILGINPLHFNGARLPDISQEPFTTTGPTQISERPIFHQYVWQDTNNISREQLARTILTAESDITQFLGYSPAPAWVSQEIHRYPGPNRPEYYGNGKNVRGEMKSIHTKLGKLIQPGQRATTLIATATTAGGTLVFSDPNGNGWDTLATITVPTTLTDECEIKLFFTGQSGDQTWQVRPLKSVAIAGGNVVITVDSWLLFDPDVVEAIPIGEVTAINASLVANYVSSIEVRREFTDFTQPSAQFYWERPPQSLLPSFSCSSCSGTGCEACTLITQTGCAQIRDVNKGLLVPVPATYDITDVRWETVNWTECREADQVKVWYYAGEQSEFGLRGGCNKLDQTLARYIAILASSRLISQFRAQTSVADFVEYYRRVIPESGQNTNTIFTTPDLLGNPFGVTRGEIAVYLGLSKLRTRRMKVSSVAA